MCIIPRFRPCLSARRRSPRRTAACTMTIHTGLRAARRHPGCRRLRPFPAGTRSGVAPQGTTPAFHRSRRIHTLHRTDTRNGPRARPEPCCRTRRMSSVSGQVTTMPGRTICSTSFSSATQTALHRASTITTRTGMSTLPRIISGRPRISSTRRRTVPPTWAQRLITRSAESPCAPSTCIARRTRRAAPMTRKSRRSRKYAITPRSSTRTPKKISPTTLGSAGPWWWRDPHIFGPGTSSSPDSLRIC